MRFYLFIPCRRRCEGMVEWLRTLFYRSKRWLMRNGLSRFADFGRLFRCRRWSYISLTPFAWLKAAGVSVRDSWF